jgi:proline racemase
MVAALFTEPAAPGAHAGLVFMDAGGYRAMSGHGIVAAATIAFERELFYSREATGSDARLTIETRVGLVQVRARLEGRGGATRVDSVAFTGVPAFVHSAGHGIAAGGRGLRVDVAYGGMFYAIVDTEAIGVPLTGARVPELRRLGAQIASAVNASLAVEHPQGGDAGVAAVLFTGPAQDPEAHLRAVAVTRDGVVNRAPSGTGISAVISVLDAMGLLPDGQPFVLEGLTGALCRGRASGRSAVGEHAALITEIEGTAWITGEHTFHLDEDDPFRDGFIV